MEGTIRANIAKALVPISVFLILATFGFPARMAAQQEAAPSSEPAADHSSYKEETTQDYNQRISELARETKSSTVVSPLGDYEIGPEDLLDISVLEAPDLNRTVRVSDDGTISLALLGAVPAAGLSTRELQAELEDRLRHSYMVDPQVSVFVQDMRSHPVSVFGSVQKPGVYQIRRAKTLVEVLSMAQGLADDAGDTIIIMRHPSDTGNPAMGALVSNDPPHPSTGSEPNFSGSDSSSSATEPSSSTESVSINLKDVLDSTNSRGNVLVYTGDVVKVSRAGIVYVVGQVNKPGGFVLKTNENISVLQAVALAEGMTPNSKGKAARIFVAEGSNGSRREVAINLDKIMEGKEPAPLLKPNDVLFIPNSASKETLRTLQQSTFGIAGALGGAAIYRW
ncbi:MAG: polysaccharide biosynthesis/export family protein [Candidatus Acidiferrum sp.]